MTPENVLHVFKEALNNDDVDVIVSTLERDDMDVNFRDVTHDLLTPLMQLCHSNVDDQCFAEFLLDVIASTEPEVDVQDAVGRTLAMHACIASRRPFLEYILSREHDVTICDRTGKNVFHYGACSGSDDIMSVLLLHPKAKSALRVLDFKGYSPLDLARQNKVHSIVKKISQTLSGNCNPVTTNQQILKPTFKSSITHQGQEASAPKDIVPVSRPTRVERHISDASTSSGHSADFPHSERDVDEFESSAEDVPSVSFKRGQAERFASPPDSDEHLNKRMFSTRSPLPHPRSKFLGDSARVMSRSGTSSAHKSADSSEEFHGSGDSRGFDSSVERANDSHMHDSNLNNSPVSTSSGSNSPLRRDGKVPGFDSKQVKHAPYNKATINPNVEHKPLAPVLHPRRKLNLDINADVGRVRSTSGDRSPSQVSGEQPKARQVISELRPDPRKPLTNINFQTAKHHGSQMPDKNSPMTRPKMALPFKKGTPTTQNTNRLKATESGNLNALLSPQQPHKRLLHKRQREALETADKVTRDKESVDDTNSNQETDSLFEEEITLDSRASSGGLSLQGQSRQQARRSSLSLPDLRDMTGCLVTSRSASPSQDGARSGHVMDSANGKDESPMTYYSDDDDDDDDDAVLENDPSDECIEDCFDDEVDRYTDLVKPRRLYKGNDANIDDGKSNRPLPVINVATPRKGKSFLKF